MLNHCGSWDPRRDAKLKALEELLKSTHAKEKVLVFTQFADTSAYLEEHWTAWHHGVGGVTGGDGGSDGDRLAV